MTNDRIHFVIGCALLGLLVSAFALAAIWGHAEARDLKLREESGVIGDRLFDALYAYKRDRASFPVSLDDLVASGHLARIEPPTWGARQWSYKPYLNDDGTVKGFWLEVGIAPDDCYPCLYRAWDDRGWAFDN